MLSKKCALFAAVLLSVSGFGAAAADNEESLWSYADPSADVVLYINTKQPEKAMDKDIWDGARCIPTCAISGEAAGLAAALAALHKNGNVRALGIRSFQAKMRRNGNLLSRELVARA